MIEFKTHYFMNFSILTFNVKIKAPFVHKWNVISANKLAKKISKHSSLSTEWALTWCILKVLLLNQRFSSPREVVSLQGEDSDIFPTTNF